MQCYCEPEPKVTPSKCGATGENCMCNGLVFYMRKTNPKNGKDFTFYEAINNDYTVNNANNSKSLNCSESNFEGVIPALDEENVCWCDEK